MLPEQMDEMSATVDNDSSLEAHAFVGLCDEALQALSDTDLQLHILHCAEQAKCAHDRNDHDAADMYWRAEVQAIVIQGNRP